MWNRFKNWFKTAFKDRGLKEVHVIVESPSSYYRKTGQAHPNANSERLNIGNVVECQITERKAIITRVIFLPPDKNYPYRFDGIGFDGHGWWSHHANFIAETLDSYLESLKNNERQI